MPVPVPVQREAEVFPPLTRAEIDAARTSAWYETFEDLTVPATIIDVAAQGEREAFMEWIDSDSIFIPHHAGEQDPEAPVYRLPKLNEEIQQALKKYGSVFPKLNWTSPRDAAFLLPQGDGPLNCSMPQDIYLLLKSSDFVQHDLDPERAYAGALDVDFPGMEITTPLELVLKKYEMMNPAREVRCFVRDNILLAVSQRDTNFYDHLQSADAQRRICDAVRAFWEDEVFENYAGGENYVFDLHLSDNYAPQLLDFQPYRETTDSLLFTYDELRDILLTARQPPPSDPPSMASLSIHDPSATASAESTAQSSVARALASRPRLPLLRVIDSPSHPAAVGGMPAFGANMLPLEMVQMSEGRTVDEFREAWAEAVAAGIVDDGDEGLMRGEHVQQRH